MALVPLVWLVATLVIRGIEPLLDIDWWTLPERKGGAANAIVGTLMQTALAAVISIPLGIFVAIYLVEYATKKSLLARVTTFMVDILSGVPSIVAALFVYAVWRTSLGLPRSGVRGGDRAGAAHGAARGPCHRGDAQDRPAGSARGVVCAGYPEVEDHREDRAADGPLGHRDRRDAGHRPRDGGESAPVLILVGSTRAMNWNPFDGNQESLPLMMVQQYNNGPGAFDKVWGAALCLVILVAIVYFGAKVVSKIFAPKTS